MAGTASEWSFMSGHKFLLEHSNSPTATLIWPDLIRKLKAKNLLLLLLACNDLSCVWEQSFCLQRLFVLPHNSCVGCRSASESLIIVVQSELGPQPDGRQPYPDYDRYAQAQRAESAQTEHEVKEKEAQC